MQYDSISTLFLDIGGVLLTNGWDGPARRRVAEHFGLDVEQLNDRHHLTYDTHEAGKLSLDDYLDRVVFYNRREFNKEDFKAFMFAQSRALPEMIQYFQNLKSQLQLKIVAVSNEGRELTEYRIRSFNLDKIIDVFICSCYVRLRKPDLDIYRLALDVSQAKPEQVVYVDDRAMFVEVARHLGIRGIHHRGLSTTRKAMEDLGLRLPSGQDSGTTVKQGRINGQPGM